MEFGKILLGAAIGAGALWIWQQRQEKEKENPVSDYEILGLAEKIDRLEDSSSRHTPGYLHPPQQPAMMPMPYQQPMYPYGRGLF